MRRFGRLLTTGVMAVACAAGSMRTVPAQVPPQKTPEELIAERTPQSDALIRQTLRTPGYVRLRVRLIEQIEQRQLEIFFTDLVAIVGDEERDVREAAARAIASFGWKKMSEPMFLMLARKTLPVYVRELAMRTLVNTGRREVVEPLIGLLDEPALAADAVRGLQALTLQDIEKPEDWRTWWEANREKSTLEWVRERTARLNARIAELEAELDAGRRRAAELEKRCAELEGVAADATIRSLEERADKKDLKPLIASLDAPFTKVQLYAAVELGKLKLTEAVPKLSELAAGKSRSDVRAACADALGLIGSPQAVPVLSSLLADADEDVASASARALGRMKEASVVNRLLAAGLSRSPKVREASAEALGQIGNPQAVDLLMQLLEGDRVARVRERAARALGEIGDKRAREALEKALEDRAPGVRIYAIEALGALKDEKIAPRLCTVLEKDANAQVREAAALTLGKVGAADALDILIRTLKSDQEKLAEIAASSILAICRRDETLFEATAEKLLAAGEAARAAELYEMLAASLAEKKEDQKLIAVRVKLADVYIVLKQWTRADTLLEELTKTMPDDLELARKRARGLTELKRHSEAFLVYQKLATVDKERADGYWPERLALLEAMLVDKKAGEVSKLLDLVMKDPDKLPTDVRSRLEGCRKRCDEIVAERKALRAQEIRALITEVASKEGEARDAARKKLLAAGDEPLPHLVRVLDDADERVRRAAVELLREIAKQDFGYRPEAELKDNAEAIRKWQEWVKGRLKTEG